MEGAAVFTSRRPFCVVMNKVNVKRVKGGNFSVKIQTSANSSVVVGITGTQARTLTTKLLKLLPSEHAETK
jgi:hypothetical protein